MGRVISKGVSSTCGDGACGEEVGRQNVPRGTLAIFALKGLENKGFGVQTSRETLWPQEGIPKCESKNVPRGTFLKRKRF